MTRTQMLAMLLKHMPMDSISPGDAQAYPPHPQPNPMRGPNAEKTIDPRYPAGQGNSPLMHVAPRDPRLTSQVFK